MKHLKHTFLLLLLGISIPVIAIAGAPLDPNFGTNGQLITKISSFDDNAHAIAVQTDGKIVVAGKSENGSDTDFAIARYHKDGSLDTSFNTSGQVSIAIGSGNDNGLSIAIQEDGKILVAGTTENDTDHDIAIIRLHNDGLPDMDFDDDGQVIISIPDSNDTANSILLKQDGKIILAGSSEDNGASQIVLLRLNHNGSIDTSFGDNGFVKRITDTDEAALSAATQTDGHIILGGFKSTGDFSRAALFSFLENGQPDKTFGTDGLILSGSDSENSLFYDIATLQDDKIIAAGATIGEEHRSILLAGFTQTGTTDQQFNK